MAEQYPNLPKIKQSIKLLYERLTPENILKYSHDISFIYTNKTVDPVLEVKYIVNEIINHLGIIVDSVSVNFVPNLNVPAQVTSSYSNKFAIKINSSHKFKTENLTALLAHEVMHIFLNKKGLNFKDTISNEILTDTAACYLGLGVPILDAMKLEIDVRKNFTGGTVRTEKTSFYGYLKPWEYGYIIAKRLFAFNHHPNSFKNKLSEDIYNEAFDVVKREYSSSPLNTSSISSKIIYSINRYNALPLNFIAGICKNQFTRYSFQKEFDRTYIIFECVVCSQRLRLPAYKSNIIATCPVCKNKMACNT